MLSDDGCKEKRQGRGPHDGKIYRGRMEQMAVDVLFGDSLSLKSGGTMGELCILCSRGSSHFIVMMHSWTYRALGSKHRTGRGQATAGRTGLRRPRLSPFGFKGY